MWIVKRDEVETKTKVETRELAWGTAVRRARRLRTEVDQDEDFDDFDEEDFDDEFDDDFEEEEDDFDYGDAEPGEDVEDDDASTEEEGDVEFGEAEEEE